MRPSPTVDHLIRFESAGRVRFGILTATHVVPYSGAELTALGVKETPLQLSAIRALCPVDPRQVLGIGINHPSASHRAPVRPLFFAKSHSALCGTNDTIDLPPQIEEVVAEAELAVVIGKKLFRSSPEEAEASFVGAMVANDITGLPLDPWHMLASKGTATFAPVGGSILCGLDLGAVSLTLEVNGKKVAAGNTKDLYLSPAEVVSTLSEMIRLQPGDVVFTGAVAISASLRPGDCVAVAIPGLVRIENAIRRRPI